MNFVKKRIAVFLALVFCLGGFNFSVSAAPEEIHVSPYGNDTTADGSSAKPYKTLEAAKNAASECTEGTVKVLFHAGTYKIDKPMNFTQKDSGDSGENPVIYANYGDGEVIFTGSVRLDGNNFKNITDVEILKRLPAQARTKVKEYDLSLDGLSFSQEDTSYPQLFADNEQQIQARYPNSGYLNIDETDNSSNYFVTYDENAARWKKASEAVVVGSFDSGYSWSLQNLLYTESQENGYRVGIGRKAREKTEWYIKNLLEEIDMPGEYFVDRETNMLYYYPEKEDISGQIFEITDFQNENIINIASTVSNITFDGLTFEKSGGGAVFSEGNNSNINIKNCNFKFLQGDTVLKIHGENCNISDNYAYGCGGGFIRFSGGDRTTLEAGNIVIENNRISACGYNLTSGVILAGVNSPEASNVVGNGVKNNIIQDCTTTHGISIPGNNSKVIYNEIYNQGRHISDGGAIYFGRSNTKYGNEVAYNYIHDLNMYYDDSSKFFCGLYSDDGYGGISMHHNVLENMERAMIAGVGMNCNFSDNLMINCRKGLFLQTRMDFGGSSTADTMYNEALLLSRYNYRKIYYAAYPDLEKALSRTPFFAPWNTVAVGNVSISEKGNVSPLFGVPNHKYVASYEDNEPVYVISGENEVPGIEDALYLSNGVERVDEMQAYGTKIYDDDGNNMNATEYGNLQFAYDSRYFVNDAEKNYTLTDLLDSEFEGISTVGEIDMEKIGIMNTSNGNIFAKKPEKVYIKYPTDGEENVADDVTLSWRRIPNASNYTVTVSENPDLSSPVFNEVIWGNHSDTACSLKLSPGSVYYWQVSAKGIGRQDSFEIKSSVQSFSTASESYIEKQNAKYALELLNNDILLGKEGIFIYDDEMMAKLEEEAKEAEIILETALSQNEIDQLEEKLYIIIAEAEEGQQAVLPRITRCAPDQQSDIVYVEGSGFKGNSTVSVLVTNPNYDLGGVSEDRTLKSIQYAGMVKCDSNGSFKLEFSTKVNDIDMPGEYTVYVTNSAGRTIKNTYCYATVELGEVRFQGENGEVISDLSQYSGKTVDAFCNIVNRLPVKLSADVVTSVFADGILSGVNFDKDIELRPNSSQEVCWKVDIPLLGAENVDLKILLWQDMTLMKPLTTVRVISQKNSLD